MARPARLTRRRSESPVSSCILSIRRASVSALGTSSLPESISKRRRLFMLCVPRQTPSCTRARTAFLSDSVCLVGRPSPRLDLERCDGHLPLLYSASHRQNSLSATTSDPVPSNLKRASSPLNAFKDGRIARSRRYPRDNISRVTTRGGRAHKWGCLPPGDHVDCKRSLTAACVEASPGSLPPRTESNTQFFAPPCFFDSCLNCRKEIARGRLPHMLLANL